MLLFIDLEAVNEGIFYLFCKIYIEISVVHSHVKFFHKSPVPASGLSIDVQIRKKSAFHVHIKYPLSGRIYHAIIFRKIKPDEIITIRDCKPIIVQIVPLSPIDLIINRTVNLNSSPVIVSSAVVSAIFRPDNSVDGSVRRRSRINTFDES